VSAFHTSAALALSDSGNLASKRKPLIVLSMLTRQTVPIRISCANRSMLVCRPSAAAHNSLIVASGTSNDNEACAFFGKPSLRIAVDTHDGV